MVCNVRGDHTITTNDNVLGVKLLNSQLECSPQNYLHGSMIIKRLVETKSSEKARLTWVVLLSCYASMPMIILDLAAYTAEKCVDC